jgi:hypothetical protein
MGFVPLTEQEYLDTQFAVLTIPRYMAAQVAGGGFQDWRAYAQVPFGHYMCPFLPHRWNEMHALGFQVRAGELAVVVDVRVLRNGGVRLHRVAGFPGTPSFCPPGHGLLFANMDIPPIAIVEIREFSADCGRILYTNPYHRFLAHYTVTKFQREHEGSEEVAAAIQRVEDAEGGGFQTTQTHRVLRNIFSTLAAEGKGTGKGQEASTDEPAPAAGEDSSSDSFRDEFEDDLALQDIADTRTRRTAQRAERSARRNTDASRDAENVRRNARSQPFEPFSADLALAQILHCTTVLEATRLGLTPDDIAIGREHLHMTFRAPRLFRNVTGFADKSSFRMVHWPSVACNTEGCRQLRLRDRGARLVLGWRCCPMCSSDSPGAILRDDECRVTLRRAIMNAFDRAVPRIPILNWCMNAGTLASCNFSHAPAATAASVDRYDKRNRKNRDDAVSLQRQLATVGSNGVLYGGVGGYVECWDADLNFRDRQQTLGRGRDWMNFMWDAQLRRTHTPLRAADSGPRPPRGFSVMDVLESYVVPDLTDPNHPSMLLPPASHEPLNGRNAALRSDQRGWDDTDVRTNQCIVGVALLQEEVQHYAEAQSRGAEPSPASDEE